MRARDRRRSRSSCASGCKSCRRRGKLLERQRLEQRTMYDLEIARADGLLHGHRELLAPPHRARQPGEPPPTLMDYFPEGLPAVRRRVAPDGSADRRRCTTATARARRRSSSSASACRARSTTGRCGSTSGEQRATQTIYVSATPGDYELNEGEGRRRRADHPADRPARSRGRGAPGRAPGRRPARRDPRARRRRRARAGHDADQAHGRGSDRVLPRARRARCATCTPTSTRSSASRSSAICGAASSTCSSASTCCARASISPRCRWSAILDADKEGFLRSERSLIQTIGRAARNVNGQGHHVRRPHHRRR